MNKKEITVKDLKNCIIRNWWKISIYLYAVLTPLNVAFAAEAKWNGIVDFIVPWVIKIGGATAFIGGIIFGAGWKQNDAEAKTNGLNTVIAGCIIAAVAYASDVFFF